MKDIDRITLAAREQWITSTRGKDLPRLSDFEAKREYEPGDINPERALRALELHEAGHSNKGIARRMQTTEAQAKRLVKRGIFLRGQR